MVIWITGLSGAGKSTIARALSERLRAEGRPCLLLDGDEVRQAIADPHTAHDVQSRLRNALRICRLAHLAERQGLLVVVATMSLFHHVHGWNREHFSPYLEVWVRVDFDQLQARDARGLYSRHARGEENDVVGLDIAVEEPVEPHLVLDNTAHRLNPEDHVENILTSLARVSPAV